MMKNVMRSLFTRAAVRVKYGYEQEYNANSPGNQPFRQNFATSWILCNLTLLKLFQFLQSSRIEFAYNSQLFSIFYLIRPNFHAKSCSKKFSQRLFFRPAR